MEDFSAAVDFLGELPFVDRGRIGLIGVCGSGGFGLAAAEIDPRIKAVATVSMYDMAKPNARAWQPTRTKRRSDGVLRRSRRSAGPKSMARSGRWSSARRRCSRPLRPIDREFYDYYRTPRGQHPRATTAFSRTSDAQMMLFWSYQHLNWISPRPVLFITGDRAHSRIFSEHADQRASDPKELFIVPGAGHVDLYDRVKLIPWEKLESFFDKHLAGTETESSSR